MRVNVATLIAASVLGLLALPARAFDAKSSTTSGSARCDKQP
jgi:hypothetical protein